MTNALRTSYIAPPQAESRLGEFARAFLTSRRASFGAAMLLVIVIASIFAPWISPQNPYDLNQVSIFDSMLPPGTHNEGAVYVLGTDSQGRDMLSAIMFGLRTSIVVAGVAIGSAFIIGTAVGLWSGFLGGWVDAFVMRVVDLQMSIPPMLIALLLLAVLGSGMDKIIIAIIIVYWAYFARVARGSALAEKRKEYIEADRCLVLPRWRIMRHLLLNCLSPVVIIATVLIGRAIQLEATLSFLGLGVSVTEPSLGLLIANGFDHLLSGKYWISMFPGLALLLLVLAINLVGDHVRDILNPRYAA